MKKLGPGTMVTAAFIGPGTITSCTIAGASYGQALLWALLFSIVATYILQEMCARLGVVSRQGLGEALRAEFSAPLARTLVVVIVVAAIFVGNSAYEGGNISGAALGLSEVFAAANIPYAVWPLLISIAAFLLLWRGRLRLLENALMGLVLLMSVAFVGSFLLLDIDWSSFFRGLLLPSIPPGSVLTVVALIGTTVVPYNLFLHAAAARDHWSDPKDIAAARQDLFLSVSLGGLISIAVVSSAAAAFFAQQISVATAADLGRQLQPLLGDWASLFMGVGLLAAGLSSAITAPLAGAYALSGVLGWQQGFDDPRFKATWLIILCCGAAVAVSGVKPIAIIWFAQFANGLMLPLLAIFLLRVMNNVQILAGYCNTWRQNALGGLVVAVSLLLSYRSLSSLMAV